MLPSLKKAWRQARRRLPKPAISRSTVRKVHPDDQAVSPGGGAMMSKEIESVPLVSVIPSSTRETTEQVLQHSLCDVADAGTDHLTDAADAVTDASLIAADSAVAQCIVRAAIARYSTERNMQRTKTTQTHLSNQSGPRRSPSSISQAQVLGGSPVGELNQASIDVPDDWNDSHAPGLFSPIPESVLAFKRRAGKSSSCSQASAAETVLAACSVLQNAANASSREPRRLQTTPADQSNEARDASLQQVDSARHHKKSKSMIGYSCSMLPASMDENTSVLHVMEEALPKPKRALNRAKTKKASIEALKLRCESVHTTGSSLAVAIQSQLAKEVCAPSFPTRDMIELRSMQVTQDVSLMPEIEAPTSFEPSFVSVTGILPPLEAVAEFQGAWELIGQDQQADNWLRSFIITGRFYFAGDGSENFLRFRNADATVLLEGGPLAIEDGTLTRRGKSGQFLRFQHFELPTEDMVEDFQGVWSLFGIIADTPQWLPPTWLLDLTIQGRVWEAGEKGGILKVADSGAVCLHDGYELWLEVDGENEFLFLANSEHECLQYEFRKGVPYPWHRT